ncbi:hypothetical protein RHSIM_Rhsim07G0137500 [Rhododendron simsii]|uniref:Tf2-1-like SH3-like domain-containing protein n=1 Tax=Rhododendron simsii TaxID=118357 RepID=A0A834LJ22_RHOSS|nr:hypothetical protein RHSIM_Rhsim07G0137500 [Rhododendron simsii]
MRIQGNVEKKLIVILIDSESTHNFLSLEVVKRLGVHVTNTDPLPVSVVDGTKMVSTTVCKGFHWEMQWTRFQADKRVLHLKGCDMVLGIQWLATLGPVKWDFKNLNMDFTLNGKIHVVPEPINTKVETLLAKFEEVFQESKGLPPSRTHDHQIPWKPRVKPPNSRPYSCYTLDNDCTTALAVRSQLQQLIADLIVNASSHIGFLWDHGVLTYKGSLVVGNSTDHRGKIIAEYHTVDNWATERAAILRMLRENLHQAQHRDEALSLQRNMKLALRFYGPFQVLPQVGKVAYKLSLLDSAQIHPIFLVSLLKKKSGANVVATPTLPPVIDDGTLQIEPVVVLERRMVKRNN